MIVLNPKELWNMLNRHRPEKQLWEWFILCELAEVSSVEFSDKIPTACIKRSGSRYSILFSPDFVRRFLETKEDLDFVVYHELMHKLQGDLVSDLEIRDKRDKLAANMAEDMLINAFLIELLFPFSVPLFDRLYDKNSFPEALLVPPPNYAAFFSDNKLKRKISRKRGAGPKNFEKETPPLLSPRRLIEHFERLPNRPPAEKLQQALDLPGAGAGEALWKIYEFAWFDPESADLEQLYRWLRELLPPAETIIILLGDHEDKWQGLDEFGNKLGSLPGYREEIDEQEIEVSLPPAKVSKLVRLLRAAMEPDLKNPVAAIQLAAAHSLIPAAGRKENLFLAAGVNPVFFKRPEPIKELDYLRPRMYIDVSGSTQDRQPELYGLALHFQDLLGEPLYLFSNRVEEISLADLRKGRVLSTGGTDYDCVIEHALRNRFRKIIVVTDGEAYLSPPHCRALESGRVEVYLILTDDEPNCPLNGYAKMRFVM